MLSKRGQFYLITALIIAVFIVAMISVVNYSKRLSFRELYDIGEELKIESEGVLDYGIYNKLNNVGMENLLTNFTIIYTKYKKNAQDLYFVFGDEDNLTIAGYVNPGDSRSEIKKIITLTIPSQPGNPIPVPIENGNYTASKYPLNGAKNIILNINEINYYFKLGLGEYLYFIIAQEIDEQCYIVTNEEK